MAFKSYYKLVKYEKPLPFYVEDVSGNANTVSIMGSDAMAPTFTIETSTDNRTWTTLGQTSATALNISVPANGRVYVRCSTTAWSDSNNHHVKFNAASRKFKVGGNIMSLLYGSNFTGMETSFPSGSNSTFFNLFGYNSNLSDASELELPATTLVNRCYASMFQNCLITSAPELPATTLAEACYASMFNACRALVAAPELPATTLAQQCYQNMFSSCHGLTTTPELPATTLAVNCYNSMFSNCGRLTTSSTLPAATLAGNCYYYMFYNCIVLNSVTCLATDISASGCTTSWLNGVSATGTFTKSASMSSWTTGVNGIPSGWTVQDAQ